jgi:hypothetical protein
MVRHASAYPMANLDVVHSNKLHVQSCPSVTSITGTCILWVGIGERMFGNEFGENWKFKMAARGLIFAC